MWQGTVLGRRTATGVGDSGGIEPGQGLRQGASR